MIKKISVIISTHNEEKNTFFLESLKLLSKFKNELEVIIVDLNSTDRTVQLALDHGFKIILTSSNSRGERLNIGAQNATSSMFLFYHPRSLLTALGIEKLLSLSDRNIWGGFTHRFDDKHLLLKFTSWYSNQVRAKIRGILYLDHCIFCSKKLYEKSPFQNIDIFEDTIFSLGLSRLSPLVMIDQSSTTSAIRFRKNGIYRQAFLNQILKLGFNLNIDHKLMNKIYEFGINLNSKY